MTLADAVCVVFVVAGCGFFSAGSVGMLRLPDALTRLHAVTKADNVGLGLVVIGLMFRVESPYVGARLVLIWLLVMMAGATASNLMARRTLRSGTRPWRTQ